MSATMIGRVSVDQTGNTFTITLNPIDGSNPNRYCVITGERPPDDIVWNALVNFHGYIPTSAKLVYHDGLVSPYHSLTAYHHKDRVQRNFTVPLPPCELIVMDRGFPGLEESTHVVFRVPLKTRDFTFDVQAWPTV